MVRMGVLQLGKKEKDEFKTQKQLRELELRSNGNNNRYVATVEVTERL